VFRICWVSNVGVRTEGVVRSRADPHVVQNPAKAFLAVPHVVQKFIGSNDFLPVIAASHLKINVTRPLEHISDRCHGS